ncbi:hypothetical protein LOK49_LG06G02167 [Camellia lanceoleosa]|uniref:Uncharacterized protein n=1 Tax=Camellia lanceoleosa TaxID=1840588 RepID=A0ACC0HA26_9ERIC|nr:hypothetical protein LOK49_LG06G02167 [Camellia lanceoleosa]
MSQPEKKYSIPAVKYPEVIPTVDPYITIGKLKLIQTEGSFSRAISEVLNVFQMFSTTACVSSSGRLIENANGVPITAGHASEADNPVLIPGTMVDATCGYFEWVDSPMCHSGREVLPKMVAKMNCLEKKLLGLLQQALRHIQLPQQTGFHLLPLVSLQLSAEASFTSSSILRGAIVALMQITLYLVQETNETIQLDTPQNNSTKRKRKPRPSFFDQIRDKWSMKTPSLREKLPWQEQEQKQSEPIEDDEEGQCHQSFGATVIESEPDKDPSVSDLSFVPTNRVVPAPWIHGSKPNKSQFGSFSKNLQDSCENDKTIDEFHRHCEDNVSSNVVRESKTLETQVNFDGKFNYKGVVYTNDTPIELTEKKVALLIEDIKRVSFDVKLFSFDQEGHSFDGSSGKIDSVRLPWERKSDLGSVDGDRLRKRNTILPEKLIPETN